jgi:hypothetical protein
VTQLLLDEKGMLAKAVKVMCRRLPVLHDSQLQLSAKKKTYGRFQCFGIALDRDCGDGGQEWVLHHLMPPLQRWEVLIYVV